MNLIKSLYQSFKKAFVTNTDVQKLVTKHPRFISFLKQRLDTKKFSGLPLTILSIVFLYVLLLLTGAVSDVVTTDTIVQADIRVNTLFYAFRNLSAVKVFLWITLLGESPTIIVFALVISALLWLYHKRWQIVTLWLTIIGSEGLTFFAKIIFHRPRPATAVFLEDSNSFPSGHATIAVAFYGFLTYLLLSKIKSKKYRALTILLGVIIIIAIGFSRLYLGVHYVSDIWAGYLVGLLWLIIGIAATEWKLAAEKNINNKKEFASKRTRVITVGLVSVAAVFYIIYGLSYHPQLILKISTTVQATVSSTASIFSDYNIPRYTETLIGETQEPVSFIITAKDDASLIASFKQSGWFLADTLKFSSTFEVVKFAILNKDYPTAPMTPSFWNKQVHDFGFEKSTATKSARQRNHARFWKTDLKTANGESIYVGTASLDTGIKWFVTHKISPDIDTERELLFADLQKSGAVKSFEKVKLVSPVLGQNFSGDQFFTDGGSYFIIIN